jgi:hypothetical protein
MRGVLFNARAKVKEANWLGHCETRSVEAIQPSALDCFAAAPLAMTTEAPSHADVFHVKHT